MTGEELERMIELLTNSQAKNRRAVRSLNRAVNKLAKSVSETRAQTDARRRKRLEAETYRQEARERMDADRQETREAIRRLLISNEVTRVLAQEVERELSATTRQRITALENK